KRRADPSGCVGRARAAALAPRPASARGAPRAPALRVPEMFVDRAWLSPLYALTSALPVAGAEWIPASVEPDETTPRRDLDRFRAAGGAEFLEQVSRVGFRGPLADVEGRRDFLFRLAVGHQLERGHLPRRQLHTGHAFGELRRRRGRQVGLPRQHVANAI